MRHRTRGNSFVVFPLVASIALVSCTTKDPALEAVERELAVTVTMGQFDVERGQTMSSTVHVVVDGELYPLVLAEQTAFVGLGELTRVELDGRRALIAGEIVNGVYEAKYAELLPMKTPEGNSDTHPLVGPLGDLKNKLKEQDFELMELQYELLKTPQTDDEARALLEAKIAVAKAKLDEIVEEYKAMLNEIEKDR